MHSQEAFLKWPNLHAILTLHDIEYRVAMSRIECGSLFNRKKCKNNTTTEQLLQKQLCYKIRNVLSKLKNNLHQFLQRLWLCPLLQRAGCGAIIKVLRK